ncbi:amidohydrolase [Sphingobium sp. B8D3A]|uniref:amidohydrolase n=1 Tax=unclassified Sphingobium TaxID=2611147 RepID=UPI0039B37CEF|nr:putative amidohydrolase YtcJ [Sphingobium sp. B8D3D]MCW2414585.1 putative amidohydrolase YtcJ [Sphingobium sp. B8D3A]
MSFARRTSAVLAALALGLGMGATRADAQGLIDNVNGITVDATGDLVHFTGLVISDDGRVEKRLARGEKRPDRPSFRFDGKGRTLMPGIIDAHAHVIDLGFSRLNLDLSDTNSLEEARQKIAAFAAANPGRPWIIGFGWNHEKWNLGRFPTAADLDGLGDGRPIWLERVDGHAGWANAAALTAAKIAPTSKAPVGGRIEMVAGRPSGILVDKAMALMTPALPRPQPKDYDAALSAAQDALLARGVTTVADMGTSIEHWQAYRRAGDRGALRIRILGYAAGMEQAALIAGPAPTPWLYNDRLRLGGVKLVLDGALGSRGAWLKAPYADAPKESGLALLTSAQLRNQMSRAAMDGFQLAVHAIGDQANAETLDAIEELSETYKGDRRWRIEHAQIVDPADLARFARSGTIASMQPQHATSDWAMATRRLGPERLGGAYAWRTMLDNKVPLAFGSDAPVEPADAFIGLKSATTRLDARNEPAGGWLPTQRLTLAEALRAYGRGAAYAAFAEERFGNLAPGQRADFLILDRDIELASPTDLAATQVLELWMDGKRVALKDR